MLLKEMSRKLRVRGLKHAANLVDLRDLRVQGPHAGSPCLREFLVLLAHAGKIVEGGVGPTSGRLLSDSGLRRVCDHLVLDNGALKGHSSRRTLDLLAVDSMLKLVRDDLHRAMRHQLG